MILCRYCNARPVERLELCISCLEYLCDHCHGEGLEPDAGTDWNPEPPCSECQGEGVLYHKPLPNEPGANHV